jgi:hypothetical protein
LAVLCLGPETESSTEVLHHVDVVKRQECQDSSLRRNQGKLPSWWLRFQTFAKTYKFRQTLKMTPEADLPRNEEEEACDTDAAMTPTRHGVKTFGAEP